MAGHLSPSGGPGSPGSAGLDEIERRANSVGSIDVNYSEALLLILGLANAASMFGPIDTANTAIEIDNSSNSISDLKEYAQSEFDVTSSSRLVTAPTEARQACINLAQMAEVLMSFLEEIVANDSSLSTEVRGDTSLIEFLFQNYNPDPEGHYGVNGWDLLFDWSDNENPWDWFLDIGGAIVGAAGIAASFVGSFGLSAALIGLSFGFSAAQIATDIESGEISLAQGSFSLGVAGLLSLVGLRGAWATAAADDIGVIGIRGAETIEGNPNLQARFEALLNDETFVALARGVETLPADTLISFIIPETTGSVENASGSSIGVYELFDYLHRDLGFSAEDSQQIINDFGRMQSENEDLSDGSGSRWTVEEQTNY